MSALSSKQTTVWVNGEFIESSTISISPFDPGLTIGLGVFDSLCGYEGKPFDFLKHYARLSLGAKKLGLVAPAEGDLYQALLGVMERNGFKTGKCRLRITLLASDLEQKNLVTAAPCPERKEFSSCILVKSRVNELSQLAGVKSTCYAANFLELQVAMRNGADEAIMLNTQGQLCEGATSNIFLIKNDELFTPALESGCLPGVARDTVIEICGELGINIKSCPLSLEDLVECDEAFLTSSLREVQPIESFEGRAFPTVAGEITQALQAAYKQRVKDGNQ